MFSFISKMFNTDAAKELTESNRYKIKKQEEKYLDHALNVIKKAARKGFYKLRIDKEHDDYNWAVFNCPSVVIELVELGFEVKCIPLGGTKFISWY